MRVPGEVLHCCVPDGLPHFYIYTIVNVGEAIIAKRRSYTTILSHLTAPFMESGIHNEMKTLGEQLFKYHQLEDGPVRAGYADSIRELALELDIVSQWKQFPAN